MMNRRRASACSFVIDKVLYVVGGFVGTTALRSVETFNKQSSTFDLAKNIFLPNPVSGASCAIIKNLSNSADYTYYGQCLSSVDNLKTNHSCHMTNWSLMKAMLKASDANKARIERKKRSEPPPEAVPVDQPKSNFSGGLLASIKSRMRLEKSKITTNTVEWFNRMLNRRGVTI